MRFSVNSIFVLAALACQTLATVFVTTPVAGDSFPGGKPFEIVWQNNAAAPADFGFAIVALYVGSETVQEQVVQLATSLNVTNTTSLNVTIDPSAGENFDKYFIRFTSMSVQDPNNTANPAEEFSALFALTGMSGSFTPAQKNAIATLTSNSSLSTTPPATSAPSSSNATTTSKTPSNSSSTTPSTPAKTSTTPSQPASGAISTSINFALFGALLLSGAGYLL